MTWNFAVGVSQISSFYVSLCDRPLNAVTLSRECEIYWDFCWFSYYYLLRFCCCFFL